MNTYNNFFVLLFFTQMNVRAINGQVRKKNAISSVSLKIFIVKTPGREKATNLIGDLVAHS